MQNRNRMKKKYFLITIFITIILVVLVYKSDNHLEAYQTMKFAQEFRANCKNWRNFSEYQIGRLSKLGKILYLDEVPPEISDSDSYQILVWKYGPNIEKRHLKQYSDNRIDPFESCSVNNCNITYEESAISTADIVIIHLHRTKGLDDLPQTQRNPKQIWAFLTDESPYNTFLKSKDKLSKFNGIFNWSMTYRMDSDIPVPYGRTVLRRDELNGDVAPSHKRRDVLVAIMGSNCGGSNKRWDYVAELAKYIDVHMYGKCGNLKCPGHFGVDCPKLDGYMFYLAFENSNCDEYITEKLWWNAYHKGAIPIVMGANPLNYSKLLPPNSYLNTDDFAKPSDLAKFILYLNASSEYIQYYQWKRNYEVVQEHGYFKSKSFHYCRICEALNYNEKKTKIYADLDTFWSTRTNCRSAWNADN